MPGPTNVYLSQELVFKAPVKIGDTVTATCELIEKIEEKHRLIFRTTVTNQEGVMVIDGKAKILRWTDIKRTKAAFPKRKAAFVRFMSLQSFRHPPAPSGADRGIV